VTFTVTYAPAKPGSSTAVVHIGSTDPDHRDFAFTIGAAETPYNDLAATLGHISYPASGTITSGAANKYKFPVIVKNNGNVAVPNTPIDVKLQIHNMTSGQYTVISNFTTTFFQNLAPGKSRTLNLPLSVPIAASAGTYDVFLYVDQTDALHEGVTDNNVGSTSQLVTIVQGTNGLSANLVGLSPAIPAIGANAPLNAKLQLALTNMGNLPLPTGQKMTLQPMAIDTNTLAQTSLGAATSASLSGWAGGRSGTLNAAVKLLTGLPAGTYNLAVLCTPTPAVGGVTSFMVTMDANNAPIVLTVT